MTDFVVSLVLGLLITFLGVPTLHHAIEYWVKAFTDFPTVAPPGKEK